MSGVGKSFLGVPVLRDIDLQVRAGEVHALVGENGAGKSTLMKILAGVHRADAGTVELDGGRVDFTHPVGAREAGVATVFQEFNLLPERTVAENVFLGREPRGRGLRAGVDARAMAAETEHLLEDLGLTAISPHAPVRSLSVAEQQIVEVVKAMSQNARIVSMDEPTAALAGAEVELLYGLVRRLKERGVAVLYVSHRLKEIFDLSDRITVLKDGAEVATVDTADTTGADLIRMMVGRPVSAVFPEKVAGTEAGGVRLEVSGGGNERLDGIDLRVRSGEIVGLAGLQGSGRTELAHALFGIDRFTRGELRIDGERAVLRSPRRAVRSGVALVSEDRKTQGLALHRSVLDNGRLVLDAVTPRGSRARSGRLPGIFSSLELAARSPSQEVRFLSGGNQQKVVLAKWLATDPSVVVLDEPTRGIDVGAKHAVYTLVRRLAAEGAAIVLISSELPEVLGLADRVLVLRDGRIAGELPGGASEEAVMELAVGGAPAASGGEVAP
ncbi:sugar ABC transporter ATP-binding protein [Nocardiopsis suaedae]|uniref:Sugar ABC transporter ATP-binding protein n=1 Tax=Nocardiopsis suaedae TaxID=3018444 RepID=A0ABT4TRZ9_9ACTN|nr:sugar ABC transporter ATP-binding protein [Nocardiopsis suaedae]MDA2807452.1 sugar ABC transporter ATP-binding protein [Nocardiopsis suaedae]